LNESHNDNRHITLNDLEKAAKAADISVTEVVQNLNDAANGRASAAK